MKMEMSLCPPRWVLKFHRPIFLGMFSSMLVSSMMTSRWHPYDVEFFCYRRNKCSLFGDSIIVGLIDHD